MDSENGFYDDVYGDYVFDEAEAQTSTCAVDELTGKLQLTGAADIAWPVMPSAVLVTSQIVSALVTASVL